MSPPPGNALAAPVASPASSPDEAGAWFRQQVHPHEAHLRNYLHGSFPAVRDVDDVVQESYLRVWKAKAAQPIQSAKAFLFMVARNIALDLLRRERISPVQSTDLATLHVVDHKPGVAELASAREEAALLAQAIHSLSPRVREIVVLRKLKGVPQKEIARQLGITEETVQNQVYHGVRRCGEYLARHGLPGLSHHDS